MGYTTYFDGSLEFNKEISLELADYINKFANVRHMRRDVEKIKELYPNWKDLCYNGNLGLDGEYFIGGKGSFGQAYDESIRSGNSPADSQPGLWCQWIINEDGYLTWDGGEKFYDYKEWLIYLIKHFFEPDGYILNGTIDFQGDDSDDFGQIVVVDNKVSIEYGICFDSISDISDDDLIDELQRRGYAIY